MWYPQNKNELERDLNSYLKKSEIKTKDVNGIIVPHAGYEFSGAIAGSGFSIFPKKEKAIVLAPSHYVGFSGIASLKKIETPIGKMKISLNDYPKLDYEHAIDNQIPFLQKIGFKEVLPIVVGLLKKEESLEIAKELSELNLPLVISSDLSHFFPYEKAVKVDKRTIETIENLDIKNFEKIDACGKFPLLISMNICKLKGWKPQLIEYKNSGDVIGNKGSVVGYASFWF
jgi:MEMO1 family protein